MIPRRSILAPIALAALIVAGTPGCTASGSGGGAAPAVAASAGATAGSGASAGGGAAPAAVDFAQLERDMRARKQSYLQEGAAGTGPFAGMGEGLYTQLLRLETGQGPVDPARFDGTLQQIEQRKDTADFGATAIVRILARHRTSPLLAAPLLQRMERAMLGFRYALPDPGQDEMCFWSENHQILFAQLEYLMGGLYRQAIFPNAALSGAQHESRGKGRVLEWLDRRLRYGFSEWNSPVYYEEDLAPILNLIDLAPDADVRERAAQVMDLLVFDLARLTQRGSFGVSAGRAYEEHKWSGRRQSVGDLIEILFGTRGEFRGRGSFSASFFAISTRYDVPHVLLGIGRDAPLRFVDRTRAGITFAEGPGQGISFSRLDDGLFWWGQGAYTAPETIVLSRDMMQAWNLWQNPQLALFTQLRSVPTALLPGLSSQLSPLSEGSALTGAQLYTFRTPDAMLSSVQSFRRGQVGFQQHAWQATLDLDACVWTTSPGTNGRDGPGDWTGSGSLPRCVQVENVLIALYNPALAQKAIFPHVTHAYFPKAHFDEVIESGSWTFARKGQGYLALYSAQPAAFMTTGAFADRELRASGDRNVWICQVGRLAEDGPFADFQARILAAPLSAVGGGNQPQTDLLRVAYEAPGVGRLEVDWNGTPTRDGQPIPQTGFPRFDNPYCQSNFGARLLDITFAGARLHQDHDTGLRLGEGL